MEFHKQQAGVIFIAYNGSQINTVAMKEKILDILEKHYHGRNFIESRCADELLGLFDVVALLPSDDEIEKAAEENASRLYATDSCQDTEWYATHHGFMDGADFIRNKLSGN